MTGRRWRQGSPRRWHRSSQRTDPYEAAAARIDDRRRGGPQPGDEGAAADGDRPAATPPVGPVGRAGRTRQGDAVDHVASARRRMRLLLIVFLALLLTGIVRALHNSAPRLAADCEHFRLALSTSSVAAGAPVRWTATGPASAAVVLGVDVARFSQAADGRLHPVPLAGIPLSSTLVTSPEPRLSGCRISGVFGAGVPAGKHTVSLFQLSASGGAPVTSAPLAVTKG